MAQIHWASAKSGLFNTAADWTGGVVPGALDDAILNAAGTINYVVTVTTSGTVSSIQTLATATLEVKVGSAAGGFTATTGSGSGKNGGAILVADSGEFIFDGTIDNTGKIDLNSTGDATELAIGASGGTLTGLGHLTLTDNAGNLVEATAAGATLVNDGNVISGAGTIGGGGLALVNDAHDRIEAEGSAALVIGGSANTVVNLGTLESTTVGGPTLGGLILDDDTINNVGGLIYADGAGTQVGLESTTLDGGILQSAAGGVITTLNSGDTLSAASGDLVLEAAVQVANGDSLTISGGMELVGGDGGALDVDGSSATTELLVAAGGAQLVHLGSVVMSDSADNDIAASTAGAKLEVVAATISGSGTIGGGGLDVVLYGNGMIDATGTANALTLNTGAYSIVNSGLIEATGSAGLVIDSNLRNTSTGEVKVLDGSSLTTNNATITGGTLLVGTGSSVDLNAVDVSGVTLTTQGTGTISLGGGTSLTSKDSLAGSFAVTPGTDLYVSGALDVAGTLTMITNFESENGTQIVLRGSTEFEGGGDVYMGGTIWNQNFINGNGNRNVNGTVTAYTLINMDDTISGAGNLGVAELGIDWLNIDNEAGGVIDGSSSTGNLVLDTNGSVINAGHLEGSGAAGLVVDVSVNNAGGTILATNGGVVTLQNDAAITGGVLATTGSGVIEIGGGADFTNVDNTGQVSIADGDRLYASGVIDNSGTITLTGSNHLAELDFSAGTNSLTGGGTVLLGGATPYNNGVEGNPYSKGDALVNVNNTLSGGGEIGYGGIGGADLVFTNDTDGVVDGNSSISTMTLNGGPDAPVVNLGLIEGTGSAGLTISGTAVTNTGGTILAGKGSLIALNNNASITGGVVESVSTGVVDINGGAAFSMLTTEATVDIDDGDQLFLSGTIDNTGTIAVTGYNHGGALSLSGDVTLTGAGKVVMGGTAPWNNAISGVELVNVSNTISGGGTIAYGLTFINDAGGVVDGNNKDGPITIDTVTETVTNLGLIEATGGGGVTVDSTTINNAGGTIDAATGSGVTLNAADIIGGTLISSGTGDFYIANSTFTSLTNKATVDVGGIDNLVLSGAIDNIGTINLEGSRYSNLTGSGPVTLTGSGHVIMGGTAPNTDNIGGADSFTNVNNTISGGGNIGGSTFIFTNDAAGVIDADNTAAALVFNTSNDETVTNLGLIEATGGATAVIESTPVNNTGGTISAGAGSAVNLTSGAVITGGTLTSTTTGHFYIGYNGATLSSLTNLATIDVGGIENLYLSGTIDNGGTIVLQGSRFSNLIDSGPVTLTGSGQVIMGGAAPWDDAISGGGVFDNVNNTISGGGTIGGSTFLFTNGAAGVIDADTTSTSLVFDTSNDETITNQGLIEATGGAGISIVSTPVDNVGGTISAGVGSTININNHSRIDGGVLTSSGTGYVYIGYGGATFASLTNNAQVVIGPNRNLYLSGVIDNGGTITETSSAASASIIEGAVSLTGKGAVVLGGVSPWNNDISGTGASASLTNVSNTISGGGFLGGYLSLTNDAGGVIDGNNTHYNLKIEYGGAGTSITNLGVIEASGDASVNLDGAVTNGGTIEALTGSAFNINDAVANTGVIESAGGVTSINSGLSGAGKLIVNGGTLVVSTGGAVSEATSFGSGGGTLQLEQSQSFTGRIADFTTTGSTKLDLRDIAFVSASEATFVENAGNTTGTLTVKANGATATLTLVGDYAGDTFTASSDGSGGVDIVAAPTPAVAPIRLVAAMAAMTSGSPATTSHAFSVHPQAATTLLAHTGGG